MADTSAHHNGTPRGIVAVGASAGGVEALARFAAGLPGDRIDVARQRHIATRMGKVLLCKQCQLFVNVRHDRELAAVVYDGLAARQANEALRRGAVTIAQLRDSGEREK